MDRKFFLGIVCFTGLLAFGMPAQAALTVTQPTAATVTPAGDDYATQVLGNPWDMNDTIDIDTEESQNVANQTYVTATGIFSGDTVANGANIYPLFMGYASSINLSRGANFPIDTSHYRYVTYKLRATQPPGANQFTRVIALKDGGSYVPPPTVVETNYSSLLSNTWEILTFDMVSNNDGAFHHWTDFPQLTGLRVDPASTNASGTYASAHFDIDWIRLTAPATAAQKTTVQWTDPGFSGPYTISAVDAGSVSYTLGSGVSGTSFLADTSFLPSGPYTIVVARSGASAPSATFHINSPAQVVMTAPSVRGEQALSFAQAVTGNPWGPIDATDFSNVLNFTNVSYTTPAGSFHGRPTNGDPSLFLNLHGHIIDTSVYRSLCIKQEVFGPRNIGVGSVARVFWGAGNNLTTSQDIILDDNLGDTTVSEYCIPDLAVIPLEPNPAGGTWSGTKSTFRLDPDEFTPPGGCATADACHDVRVDSVILSPFAHADPNYTFTWTLNDSDNTSVTLRLALDPDTNPGNGNEFPIYSQLASNGNGSFAWPGSGTVPSATYHVLATTDDGVNIVNQYAGGVIVVNSDKIFRNGFQTP